MLIDFSKNRIKYRNASYRLQQTTSGKWFATAPGPDGSQWRVTPSRPTRTEVAKQIVINHRGLD